MNIRVQQVMSIDQQQPDPVAGGTSTEADVAVFTFNFQLEFDLGNLFVLF